MKFVNHCFWGRKLVRAEVEVSVIFLPVIVNHQYAGRKSVVDNTSCIFQDILLILIIYKLIQVLYCGFEKNSSGGNIPAGGRYFPEAVR